VWLQGLNNFRWEKKVRNGVIRSAKSSIVVIYCVIAQSNDFQGFRFPAILGARGSIISHFIENRSNKPPEEAGWVRAKRLTYMRGSLPTGNRPKSEAGFGIIADSVAHSLPHARNLQ
jgi:hypothetical protein